MSGKSNGTFSRQIAYTEAVTPADGTDLPGGVTRALMVGADKLVAVVGMKGTAALAAMGLQSLPMEL